jgi:hypothetical protein
MSRDSQWSSGWVGAGQSLSAASALLWLLHRVMARAGADPGLFFLSVSKDFYRLEWTWPYLIAVATACILAVARRDHTSLARVQWYALAGGLFLVLYGLGSRVGEKVDPRYVFGILGGVASLYSCYACLFAHAAIAVSCRVWSGRSEKPA